MAKSNRRKVPAIVGRTAETAQLAQALRSREAEFIVVYGRRRVGKTHLIREFFSQRVDLYFEVTGQNGGPMSVQLMHFQRELERVLYSRNRFPPLISWENAFDLMATSLEEHAAKRKRPMVVFLDELPWLAGPRSRLLESLDHVWNARLSKLKNLCLVVCGSAASFMMDKIINAKGGLHNRVTQRIRLQPFSLAETQAFLTDRGLRFGRRQVLEIYLALGGVPHYLKQIKRGKSAAQAIGVACFDRAGPLYDEFPRLLASLFRNAPVYESIVRALHRKTVGLTRGEISQATAIPSGGTLVKKLRALEEADFIAGFTPYGRRNKDTTYRLIDEYTTFYLKWIERAPRGVFASGGDTFWATKSATPSYRAWVGYAFEGVCLKHSLQIGKALGLQGIAFDVSSWRYQAPAKSKEQGAQIDLLFDRSDGVITLCELKYSLDPFKLTKGYARDLAHKANVFRERTGTRKDIQIALITPQKPAQSLWLDDIVDCVVVADDLFAE